MTHAYGEMVEIFEAAISQGWRIEKTEGNHYKCIPADKTKRIVYCGSTVYGSRVFKNIKSEMRRSGLKI